MTVRDVIKSLGAQVAVEGDTTRPVTAGYACDLLSEVIAKATPGSVWATIQTHVNIIAVAAMVGISIVIVCEGRTCESDAIDHAAKEHLTVLYSGDSAYVVSGKLYVLGLR
ncbi:MAG: iron-sulfur binding hydrogenase [Caldiserica bacterium]|nr:iron-sulfur binding hydrogenase [Caldisericota bacterium]